MKDGKLLRIGGFISGGVLIVFGIVVIALGIYGIHFTRDSIKQEGIVFGPATDPAVAEHAEKWAGEPVETGSQALAFAEIMREHTLASTGGLTYAEMGRYQSAENPEDAAGTNDEAAAAKDENGNPISNGARDIWVTETALTTALNMATWPRCSRSSASSSALRSCSPGSASYSSRTPSSGDARARRKPSPPLRPREPRLAS